MPITQICNNEAFCKCCDSNAYLYDLVDFNKSCNVKINYVMSGIPVYYYKCSNCGFIFTQKFDAFSNEDFEKYIYNENYILVDPDYAVIRPQGNAKMMGKIFSEYKNMEILDYGGGNGLFEEHLKDIGFTSVSTYDPFNKNYNEKPDKKFDCIVCFEVIEHSTRPKKIFTDLFSMMKEDGFILFSTLLQPDGINEVKCNWWYAGPRSGHVSLHSAKSLRAIAEIFDCEFLSIGTALHVMFYKYPEFINNLEI